MTDRKVRTEAGTFAPGNPGKKPGTLNRFTSLKQSFLDAFVATGGAKGLQAWVKASPRNRALFYQMMTRLFPQEMQHSGSESAAPIRVIYQLVEPPEGGNGDGGNGNEGKRGD